MITSGVEGALINLKAAAVLDKDQVAKRLARASAWMAHQFSRVWNTCLKGSCRLLALRRIALGERPSFRAMASTLFPLRINVRSSSSSSGVQGGPFSAIFPLPSTDSFNRARLPKAFQKKSRSEAVFRESGLIS
jgi:hypothetical protein